MPPHDKQMYHQLINTLLKELDQEDHLGQDSQAVVALKPTVVLCWIDVDLDQTIPRLELLKS